MKNCCIQGCEGSSKRDVTLFEFPTSRLLRRRWLDAIGPSAKLSAEARVCARHFSRADYERVRGRTRLKGKVVPTVFGHEAQIPTDPLKDPLGLPDSNTENEESQGSTDKELTSNDNHNGKVDNDNGPVDNDNGRADNDNGKVDNDNGKVAGHNERVDNDSDSKSSCKNATENGHNEKTDNHNENIDNKKTDNHSESIDNTSVNIDNNSVNIVNDSVKIDNDNGNDDNKRVAEKVGSKKVKKKWVPMRRRVKVNGDLSEDSSSQDSVNSDLPPPPLLEDLEEQLPNYQIANMKTERQVAAMTDTIHPEEEPEEEPEELTVEPHVPVFIELSVGQDNSLGSADANDCLMVVESVQCDVDPAMLLLARGAGGEGEGDEEEGEGDDDCTEHIDIDDDDDDVPAPPPAPATAKPPSEPISLLTSSDEDDVILQEPHVDTLSVSDETDEDDLPLLRLLHRERAERRRRRRGRGPEPVRSILLGAADHYCTRCHHVSDSASAHHKHLKTHQDPETARVYQVCKECGFTTASKSQLLRHQRKHYNEKKFKCPLCAYRSKYNMSLMYHLKSHRAPPAPAPAPAPPSPRTPREKLECRECGFEAKTKRALRTHRKTAHEHKA